MPVKYIISMHIAGTARMFVTETLFQTCHSFSKFFIISSCDLAGSERIKKTKAEGERLSEAQHINFSLLELG